MTPDFRKLSESNDNFFAVMLEPEKMMFRRNLWNFIYQFHDAGNQTYFSKIPIFLRVHLHTMFL